MYSYIGSLPIRDVKPAQLLEIMRRVAAGLGRARSRPQRLRFSFLAITAVECFSLASPHCGQMLIRLRRYVVPSRSHDQASSPPGCDRLPDLLKAIEEFNGDPATGIALHLLLLTFVRQESYGAQWSEFDLDVPCG